jgi:hypothetical protein
MALGATYRASLMAQLKRDLGVKTRRVGHAVEIEGVPEALCAAWSKRREDVVQALKERGIDSSEGNAAAAEKAALATREDKSGADRATLEAVWAAEMASLGLTPEAVVTAVRVAKVEKKAEQEADDATLFSDSDPDAPLKRSEFDAIVNGAIENLEARTAVFTREHLLQEIAERAQGRLDAAGLETIQDAVLRSGAVIALGERDFQRYYTTPRMVEIECSMVALAVSRQGEGSGLKPEIVERAIQQKEAALREGSGGKYGLSEEQIGAIRWACGDDGVTVVCGDAGTGKSTIAQAIVAAHRDLPQEGQRFQVQGLAPTHRAAGVLRDDAGIDNATALQGFLNRLDSGDEVLTDRTLLLVDEAGMVTTRDMQRLLAHADKALVTDRSSPDFGKPVAKARVCLLGDSKQFLPIGQGSPYDLLARKVGSSDLTKIVRQRADYMREASQELARGSVEKGLRAYDDRGAVTWADGRTAAFDRLVADWRGHVADRPDDTRIVLAARNADVADLNTRLRAAWDDAGMLHGPEAVIMTTKRDGSVSPLALRAGDRVIFGETFRIPQGEDGEVKVSTSELGSIVHVDPDNVTTTTDKRGRTVSVPDPRLTVRLDSGEEFTATIGEINRACYRTGDDKAPVKMQWGMACSTYASQGQTLSAVFHASVSAGSRRDAYVSGTRHRDDYHIYVDADRLRSEIVERDPETYVDRGRIIKPDLADVKAAWFKDCSRITTNANVSDFVEDLSSVEGSGLDPVEAYRQVRRERAVTAAAAAPAPAAPERVRPEPAATAPKAAPAESAPATTPAAEPAAPAAGSATSITDGDWRERLREAADDVPSVDRDRIRAEARARLDGLRARAAQKQAARAQQADQRPIQQKQKTKAAGVNVGDE